MTKELKSYQRVCIRCDNIYYTPSRFSKVCDNCKKIPGGRNGDSTSTKSKEVKK